MLFITSPYIAKQTEVKEQTQVIIRFDFNDSLDKTIGKAPNSLTITDNLFLTLVEENIIECKQKCSIYCCGLGVCKDSFLYDKNGCYMYLISEDATNPNVFLNYISSLQTSEVRQTTRIVTLFPGRYRFILRSKIDTYGMLLNYSSRVSQQPYINLICGLYCAII